MERLKELVESADMTRWSTDYLPIDDLDSGQLEGWRIHDMPDKPNPQGVWIANYVVGGIDDKDTAELICVAVNLAKALASDDAVERMVRARYESDPIQNRNVGGVRRPWADFGDEWKADEVNAMKAALSAILSDVLGEE